MKLVRLRTSGAETSTRASAACARPGRQSALRSAVPHRDQLSRHDVHREHTYAWLRSSDCASRSWSSKPSSASLRARPVRGADDIPAIRRRRLAGSRKRPIPGRTSRPLRLVDDLSSPDRPPACSGAAIATRQAGRGVHPGSDMHRSSLLISAERGDLENEFIEITAEEAVASRTASGAPP